MISCMQQTLVDHPACTDGGAAAGGSIKQTHYVARMRHVSHTCGKQRRHHAMAWPGSSQQHQPHCNTVCGTCHTRVETSGDAMRWRSLAAASSINATATPCAARVTHVWKPAATPCDGVAWQQPAASMPLLAPYYRVRLMSLATCHTHVRSLAATAVPAWRVRSSSRRQHPTARARLAAPPPPPPPPPLPPAGGHAWAAADHHQRHTRVQQATRVGHAARSGRCTAAQHSTAQHSAAQRSTARQPRTEVAAGRRPSVL